MITLLILSILFYTECWLEEVVILLKDDNLKDYTLLNRQEHFRSAVYAGVIIIAACLVVTFYSHDYFLIPAIVVNRRIFFDYMLAVKRKRSLVKYEGNDVFVKYMKMIFGNDGRKKEVYVTIAITLVCIVLNIVYCI